MAIPFYRWFPGDYARDTRHLSLMQHGVYRLLIDLYMDQGRPLRNDLPYLYRWLHAESVEEKNAVEFVLGEFFILKANSWTHKRCEEELQWREMKAESARGSAVKRWHSERNANAMRTQCDGNAIKNQNQNQIKEKPISSEPRAKNRAHSELAIGDGELIAEIPSLQGAVAVKRSFVMELIDAYPDVLVATEIDRAKLWLEANPSKRKKNVRRFLTNWVSRTQERGGSK